MNETAIRVTLKLTSLTRYVIVNLILCVLRSEWWQVDLSTHFIRKTNTKWRQRWRHAWREMILGHLKLYSIFHIHCIHKSVEQFAGWLTKRRVVILPVQVVSEDVFIWTVRPRRIVNCSFLTAPCRIIRTYSLTYCRNIFYKHTKYSWSSLVGGVSMVGG